MFAIPLNCWHRHFNGSGQEPVRYVAVTNGPSVMNLYDDPNFVFNTAYDFKNRFAGEPDYPRLATIARSIMQFAAPTGRRGELLVLMIDGDIGRGLGRIIHRELGLDGKLISVDGIRLQQLDFVDIGEFIDPPGVVPVVIKSLLFS